MSLLFAVLVGTGVARLQVKAPPWIHVFGMLQHMLIMNHADSAVSTSNFPNSSRNQMVSLSTRYQEGLLCSLLQRSFYIIYYITPRLPKVSKAIHTSSHIMNRPTIASLCGPLSLAVISRSEQMLISALRSSSSDVNERNSFAQTPLHLAIGWPFAVEHLLKAGADANALDCQGDSVIRVACQSHSIETVQILLASDYFLSNKYGGVVALEDTLEVAQHDDLLLNFIFSVLVKRRMQLLEMAKRYLPREKLCQVYPGDGRVLDETVPEIYSALINMGVSVPSSLSSHSTSVGTVFHNRNLTLALAQKLFDLKFRDVDGYDRKGQTPLMVPRLRLDDQEKVEIVHWFVSKGASLARLQRGQSWPACHFLAAEISLVIRRYHFHSEYNCHGILDQVLKSISPISRDGIFETVQLLRDDCKCACSVSGCTMHSVFVKNLQDFRALHACDKIHNYESIVPDIPIYIAWWISIVAADQVPRKEDMVEVLRTYIFHKLGLQHTCCTFHEWKLEKEFRPFEDPEDILEIQEEERITIERLEELLELASNQWDEHIGSFSEFWDNFLRGIDFSKEDNPSDDYIRGVKELGVRVEEVL